MSSLKTQLFNMRQEAEKLRHECTGLVARRAEILKERETINEQLESKQNRRRYLELEIEELVRKQDEFLATECAGCGMTVVINPKIQEVYHDRRWRRRVCLPTGYLTSGILCISCDMALPHDQNGLEDTQWSRRTQYGLLVS